MAKDLLLEIGVEEMPSAYMPGAISNLQELAEERLQEARLSWQQLKVYATPRRLVLYVEQLAESQPDSQLETVARRSRWLLTRTGTLPKPVRVCPGQGGVAVEELEIREVGGVEYVLL